MKINNFCLKVHFLIKKETQAFRSRKKKEGRLSRGFMFTWKYRNNSLGVWH